ncbi:LysR family transcriptional regulator, partial [Acinetobacter baumannii]
MLNLNQVRSFLVVLDAGGFRPAARQLGLAASTIVEHIDQLEHDLS